MKDQRTEILELLNLKKYKWQELKGKPQDVTHEDFINNVIWTYNDIIRDIENMCCD